MSNKEFPSYAALGNAHSKTRLSLYEKFAMWFRNFLENAE
ncbi:conserved hypothetical protein [Tenacibaculum sp. 190130A14a]|uniref:Uncharacterized protein n=1 Tax=Tenacibaculum polynesiense TaxID=3137857 RepID=A0ABM9PB37_9FLAO